MSNDRREVYDYKKRFGSDGKKIGKMLLQHLREIRETGEYPVYEHNVHKELTGVDRLAYYRSHGLTDCFDYPGGDAQFEADVLSGQERDEDNAAMGPLKKEDAYIISCMNNGRFAYNGDFMEFGWRPEVMLAYFENASKRGIHFLSFPYWGGLLCMRTDVLSGKYARDRLAERRGQK